MGYKDGEPSWSFGPGTFCPCCMSEDERDMIRELVENTVPEGEQVTWHGQWGNTSLNDEWLGFNPDRYKHSEESVQLSDEAREFLVKSFSKEEKVEQSR